MKQHSQILCRFFSEQGHRNYAFLNEEDVKTQSIRTTNANDFQARFEYDQDLMKNDFRRFRLPITQKLEPVVPRSSISKLENYKNDSEIKSDQSPYTAIDIGPSMRQEKIKDPQRFRWNLLFNILIWIFVPFPFWVPFISSKLAYYLITTVQGLFVLIWTIIATLALKNAMILYRNRFRNFAKDNADHESKLIRHIVAISCYKEPVDLIARSIQTVADQTLVNQITMVVSFEERTPDKESKCEILKEKFENCGFEQIIFTIHPFGIEGEIPGKCSNSNYGLRAAVKKMDISDNETDNILVTTCDADSKFPPQYIAALTNKYLEENRPALNTIYQSPLFYNWKLDSLSFVTRVTGLLRSFLMLGALIPFNINTMSIFSFSLTLAKKGNYVHPGYQMDDIICLIRWMGVTQQRLRISMIPVPVLSGPTTGETIEKEIIEWARQARRWTIGAAEVFHYFIVKSKGMPITAAWVWGISFVIYYGVLLCTSGLFSITATISMFLLIKDIPPIISYIMYGFFALQMLTFATSFIIDIFIPKLLNIEECIFFLRNMFHFIMTPVVLLVYSFVELYALHEVAIFGKKVCTHNPSKKDNL